MKSKINIKKQFKYIIPFIFIYNLIFGVTVADLDSKGKEHSLYKKEKIELKSSFDELSFKLEDKSNKEEKIIQDFNLDIVKNNVNIDVKKIEGLEVNYILAIIPNGKPIDGDVEYSSLFGYRKSSAKRKGNFHWGIDYRASIGTGILSTANGVVEYAGMNGAYGKVVIINHGYGFKTLYAHLSKIDVKEGDHVAKNQVIAKSGKTGRSTGPHLHYEVHYGNKKLDPYNFSEWNSGNYATMFKRVKDVEWETLVAQIKKDSLMVKNIPIDSDKNL